MKIMYLALNKERPKFMSEIIINSFDTSRAPAPHFFDIKHVTPLLSSDPDNEILVDMSLKV